jgi:hypothetical protein
LFATAAARDEEKGRQYQEQKRVAAPVQAPKTVFPMAFSPVLHARQWASEQRFTARRNLSQG